MKLTLQGQLKDVKQEEAFMGFLQQLADTHYLQLENYKQEAILKICPKGNIFCAMEDGFISLEMNNFYIGVGFYAYVCDLYAEIMDFKDAIWDIEDPFDYLKNHNFETLKYQHYEPWLKLQIKKCLDQTIRPIIGLQEDYIPLIKEKTLYTLLGTYAFDDLEMMDSDELIEALCIWNTSDRDAKYYLNCARCMLYCDCYYEYSNMNDQSMKAAEMIVAYLEAAYECDDTILIPLMEYNMLCDCLHHDHLLKHAISSEEKIISYRKNLVYRFYKDWVICYDGCCEVYFDTVSDSLSITAPYQDVSFDWNYYMKVSTLENKHEKETYLHQFNHIKKDETKSYVIDGYYYDAGIHLGEMGYEIMCKITKNNEILYVQAVASSESSKDKIITMIEDITKGEIKTAIWKA